MPTELTNVNLLVMETLFVSVIRNPFQRVLRALFACVLLFGTLNHLQATPEEWMMFLSTTPTPVWTVNDPMVHDSPEAGFKSTEMVSLSCLPNVNVSLGQEGYAIINPLMLVNAPDYLAFQYTVDIMGPLTNTVYCAQVGQELMVVVTEIPTGNSCMSTIHVEDKLRPLFSCTPDILPCNTVVADIDFEQYVEVDDNCDPDPELWYSYVIQALPCNPNGYTAQILVTWTATDASGNSSTCTDIIYLRKPGLGEIVFPADVSVSCTNPNIDPSVTGEPLWNGLPVDYACQLTVWYTDVTIPMCNGAYKIKRTWTVMDWCNSGIINDVQEILIVDNQPPTITCPPSVTISANYNLCTAQYTLPTPNVSDACADPDDIVITITISGVPGIYHPGQVVNLTLGSKLITMKATDPCGNMRICQYTVFVRDSTPPIISCPPDVTVDCNASTAPAQTGTATAIDFCDNTPTITYTDVTVATQGCALGYKITRTWRAMDDSGNMSMCMQMITLTDNTPPVILCPANLSIACTASTLPANTGTATASDHCDATPTLTFTDATIAGTCPQERTINRTWRATDDCGNSSSCLQIILVEDNLAPVITCPPNLTIECSANTGPGSTGTATATDNCDATPTITFSDVTTAGGPQTFIINRTWRATDDCGNSSSCLQLIQVHDSTPPVITCPANLTVQCNANTLPPATGVATATDNCDPSVALTFSDITTGGACPQERTINRTWLATDDCGNTATCLQVIVVDDSVAPVITCPANITILCTAVTLPANTGTATATDNCDASATITFNDVTIAGACPQERTINRTWSATDDCGNIGTCLQVIIVDDNLAPVIICPANVTILCNAITLPANTGTATATDNCDATVTITFTDLFASGGCAQEFSIQRTWIATDDCGNSSTCLQLISLDDNQAPTITCPANITIQCSASTLPANTGTATATDNCGGTPSITFNDVTVAGACPQERTITRTWTASDPCGNTSTCIQIIVLDDSLPPSIACPSNITIQCNASTLPANTGTATATDNCDGAPTVTFSDVTAGGACPQERTITRTWVASDHCGNSASCTQTIFVDDSMAPVITCPANVTINCSGNTLPPATGTATASDNCDASLTVMFSDVITGGGCPLDQTITRTWTATDDCGNIGSCVQIILVTDNTPPAITCPVNVTIQCTASTAPANTGTATATDMCDATPTVTFSDVTVQGACPGLFVTNRTWVATDDCGNNTSCLQIITKADNVPPICQAQNITVSLNGDGTIIIAPSQVDNGSSDACGPVTLALTPNTFDCTDIGDNPVTLTVTDCSGNSSTCTAIVTINDSGGLVANCQNVIIIVDINGNASVDPSQVDNGSGGGCNSGDLDFDLSQTNFNCSNLGPNVVILTVTDENGNTATCTAIITVIDNIPPAITCPANLTVDCHTLTDPNNTGQFGNATGTDNCNTVTITENHVINLNNCGVGSIVRTFTATDGSGNTATCVQTVSVNNPDPLDASDITWPPSPVSVNICNSTEPQNIPNGIPVINPNALLCANVVISHTDVVQIFIDNNPNTPCKVITRTWTVTDLCQMNATFMFVQIINVQDPTPPVFTNINDMTKVANANCVAFFTLIASATDCAGVTITNNSPYGVGTGANASGNYPIGSTTVIFTATDGCGNISTMDVVVTVTDPDPTEFQCEKIIFILNEETEIAVNAHDFVTFLEGSCTGEFDFIVSYSNTNPFDTVHIYDCGDVGVQTFPLYFWNDNGTMLLDSCGTADLEIRDPNDFCMDGLIVTGDVKSESGQPVRDVEVSIMNVTMVPDTTDVEGSYMIEGLTENTGYVVAPYNDLNPKQGVSTLDLVLIQKHLLGITKLNSPYKMIAADANKSGLITALDLLEIRKVILGISNHFPNNTSWRFVAQRYEFPDQYNPFSPGFPESVTIDSVTQGLDTINFVGVKVADVNGSYFTKVAGGAIESRSSRNFDLNINSIKDQNNGTKWEIRATANQNALEGMQFSLFVGPLTDSQVKEICSDVISNDQWYYDPVLMSINVSWTPLEKVDLSGKLLLCGPQTESNKAIMGLDNRVITPEAYAFQGGDLQTQEIKLHELGLDIDAGAEYHLFQNIPNPFSDGTLIRFTLPRDEHVSLSVYDITGRLIVEKSADGQTGINEIPVRSQDLKVPGIYYYTLQTLNASMTRKMSFTNN